MKNMIVIQEQASIGANGVINNMTAMWEKVVEIFESIATHSSTNMQGVMNNGAAAAKNIIKEFDAMVKKANSAFVKLANNFEKAMKNIAHNAAVAASKANKSLASIKNRTVTITYEEKGAVPKSKGGIVPFAEGGVISARGGLTTSNGPTYLYGDNSGGRETLAFLPHDGNKADKIMDQLDTMFGRRKSMTLVGGNGDRDIIIPITVNINGEQYSFTKKYRVRQNQEIASQVF